MYTNKIIQKLLNSSSFAFLDSTSERGGRGGVERDIQFTLCRER